VYASAAQSSARPERVPGVTERFGHLRLRIGEREGRTVVLEQSASAPFKVFASERLTDGTVVVQVTVTGPGVCAGDHLSQEVIVEDGAKAVVLMTSANKLLGAIDGVGASQQVAVTVADGGTLEFYPGLTIPYPNAVFEQRVRVSLAPGSRFGLLETWAMGRVGRGEILRFGAIDARTEVFVGNRPAYADALVLRPRDGLLRGHGVLEGNRYTAAGFWHWGDDLPLSHVEKAPAGTLVMGRPPTGTAYLRGMAKDGVVLHTGLRDVLRAQRAQWGLAPFDLRRYTSSLG
jgi:urease accessory protein